MAIPAEHLYTSCTCNGGMRNGLRCADCGGRGILPRGATPTGAVVTPDQEDGIGEDDGLEDMSVTHLRSRAKDLGLPSGGTKEKLVAAIREANTGESSDESGESETSDDTGE